jgi:hypothetical protein
VVLRVADSQLGVLVTQVGRIDDRHGRLDMRLRRGIVDERGDDLGGT